MKVQDKSHATKKVKGLDSVKADAQIRTSIRDFLSTVCFFFKIKLTLCLHLVW